MAAQHADVNRDAQLKSYRWLRLAMVGLLLLIAASVLWQSFQQQGLLGSVSAYYYTPAQAIFVGGLIGLGACMIALKGDPLAEDIFLNLGGMFAALVAIVPTGRNADFQQVVRACEETGTPLLTERAATTGLDCPTVQGLAEATRANVANNLAALLVVGFVGLVASWVFARREKLPSEDFLPGFLIAAGVWVAMLVAGVTALDWVVARVHLIAAIALGVCVLIVILVNARRKKRENAATVGQALKGAAEELVNVRQPANEYTRIARAALGASVIAILLWALGVITIFWLEAIVAISFIVFWSFQTAELDRPADPVAP